MNLSRVSLMWVLKVNGDIVKWKLLLQKIFHARFIFIPAGKVLSPAKKTSHSGNPWASVLLSWFLVQVRGDKQTQNYGVKTFYT